MRTAITISAAFFFCAASAYGASDGYFCSSAGYLAYELGAWNAPEKEHVLKVIRVGSPDGIEETRTVRFPDFQVHGMKCLPEAIEIVGWDKKIVVGLSDPDRPRLVSTEAIPEGQMDPSYRASSLVDSRKSLSVPIPSAREDRRYELEILHAEENHAQEGGGILYHHTTSTLLEKSADNRIIRTLLIHKGVAKETID